LRSITNAVLGSKRDLLVAREKLSRPVLWPRLRRRINAITGSGIEKEEEKTRPHLPERNLVPFMMIRDCLLPPQMTAAAAAILTQSLLRGPDDRL
jgi:hypothetical protein